MGWMSGMAEASDWICALPSFTSTSCSPLALLMLTWFEDRIRIGRLRKAWCRLGDFVEASASLDARWAALRVRATGHS
eukprot:4015306-Pyramimonas_sp.AAC.1